MSRTGLILRPVLLPPDTAAQSSSPADEPLETPHASTTVQLGRWQPDWLLVSEYSKRIAIVDLSRPADVHPGQLAAAGARKQQKYSPLVSALEHYSENGWIVHVFPWVVGIRGLLDPVHVASLLEFLDVPKQRWQSAIERSVLASVQALYYLHQVRFGGLQRDTGPDRVLQDSDSDDEDIDSLPIDRVRKRPQEHCLWPEGSDSTTDPEVDPEKEGCTRPRATAKRQRRLDSAMPHDHIPTSTVQHRAFPQRSRPSPRVGAPTRTARRGTTTPSMRWRRVKVSETAGLRPNVDSSSGAADPGGTRHRKDPHKRTRDSCSHMIYDTDDPAARQPKRRRSQTDVREETLWIRWRAVAGERRRRS